MEAINWEQRRYELAKAAMQGIIANNHPYFWGNRDGEPIPSSVVSLATDMADEMIKQFRKD